MSWSLQLRHGDLFHNQGHYATVQGSAKLIQDLRCELLEHVGNDDLHSDFGSTIDGGRLADGTEVGGVINTLDFNQASLDIETEIRRIEDRYQARQLARLEGDAQTYGRTTLRRDELLSSISQIDFAQVADTLFVTITVTPASGIPEIIEVPLRTL